jgi:hypothetical protein
MQGCLVGAVSQALYSHTAASVHAAHVSTRLVRLAFVMDQLVWRAV